MMHDWIRASGKRLLSRILEAGALRKSYVAMSAPLPDHVQAAVEDIASHSGDSREKNSAEWQRFR